MPSIQKNSSLSQLLQNLVRNGQYIIFHSLNTSAVENVSRTKLSLKKLHTIKIVLLNNNNKSNKIKIQFL